MGRIRRREKCKLMKNKPLYRKHSPPILDTPSPPKDQNVDCETVTPSNPNKTKGIEQKTSGAYSASTAVKST
jgi:hypothetical protein